MVYTAFISEYFWFNLLTLSNLVNLIRGLIFGASLLFFTAAEGLPLLVSTVLASFVCHIKEDGHLLRHLQACETMGIADNICTDMTGVLTETKMKVDKLFINEKTIDAENKSEINENTAFLFTKAICLNSSVNHIFLNDCN